MFHRKTNTKSKPQDLKPDFIAKVLTLFSHSSQRGSVLPMAVGLGVVMLGVTGVALMNSGRNKTDVASDEMTKNAVAAAEAGVARIQSLFVEEPRLALGSFDITAPTESKWNDVKSATTPEKVLEELNDIASSPDSCDPNDSGTSSTTTDPLTKATKVQNSLKGGVVEIPPSGSSGMEGGWVSVNDGTSYRLVRYSNNAGIGTLAVQGRVGQNGSSIAQIDVEFVARENTGTTPGAETVTNANPLDVPALWLTDVDMDKSSYKFQNNLIDGNIKITSSKKLEDVLKLTAAPSEKNLTNPCYTITTTSVKIPAVPAPPSGIPTLTGNLEGDLPRSATTTTVKGKVVTVPADSPIDGYYHYKIDDEVKKASIRIKDNQKVVLHLNNDMKISGSTNSITLGSGSSLTIFGSPSATSIQIGGSAKIKTGDDSTFFIHAPNAGVGVNGGASSGEQFQGTIWAKSWQGSAATTIALTGTGKYEDYLGLVGTTLEVEPVATPSTFTIGNIQNWQRKSVAVKP